MAAKPMNMAPWPRFLARAVMLVAIVAGVGWLHPLVGLIAGAAGLSWLVSRYDNHTGSLVLATCLVIGAVAILIALLMTVMVMAAR